ncbi:MAG: phage tail protein [Clostridium sp.]|nr:phage tail protein [Clostridium sp.]
MNVITGLEKVYYAVMTDETTETYGEVKELGDGIEIGVTPTENQTPLYAANKQVLVEKALGDIDLTFTIPAMSTEAQKDLFGMEEATEGGLIYKANSVKPYIAIMFNKTLDGGAMEYVTLFKGKLNLSEDKAKTQEGQVEYQTAQYSGKFVPLKDGMWKHVVRSTDTGFNAETWATKWGTSVVKATKKASLPA